MKWLIYLALVIGCGVSLQAAKLENALGPSQLAQLWALGLSQRLDDLSVIRAEDSEALLKRLEAKESDAALVRWLPSRLETLPESLHFEPVAWAAMAVYVHGSNQLTGLSREQLRDVFTGEITGWRTLNGTPYELHRYGIKEGAYGMPDFRTMLVDDQPFAPAMFTVESTEEVLVLVNGTEHGIGFGWFRVGLPPGAEALAVDGVKPEAQTVRDGSYPLRWQIGVISRKDDPVWPHEAEGLARELERPEAIEWCDVEGWVPLKKVEPTLPEEKK